MLNKEEQIVISQTKFRLTKLPVTLEENMIFWIADTKWVVKRADYWNNESRGIFIDREI
jgi:hypothetical protein